MACKTIVVKNNGLIFNCEEKEKHKDMNRPHKFWNIELKCSKEGIITHGVIPSYSLDTLLKGCLFNKIDVDEIKKIILYYEQQERRGYYAS